MGDGKFLKSIYWVGRGVLTLLFYGDPTYIAYPLFFKFRPPTTHFPVTSKPHSHCSFCWPVSLAELWSRRIWCAILVNDNMVLHMSSLGILVPERPWCVFYATRRQVYWGLTHVVFYWCSDLISHTHTNTHSALRGSQLTHSYKYKLDHLLRAHSCHLYYINMIKWIILYQKFTYYNVFSFQKLFTCKSHVSVD